MKNQIKTFRKLKNTTLKYFNCVELDTEKIVFSRFSKKNKKTEHFIFVKLISKSTYLKMLKEEGLKDNHFWFANWYNEFKEYKFDPFKTVFVAIIDNKTFVCPANVNNPLISITDNFDLENLIKNFTD